MRREHFQPDRINGCDVTHVHALGVHNLRVEEVGRLLLCEEGAGGMDLKGYVAPHGAVLARMVQVGRVGEQAHHNGLQDLVLVCT